MSNPTLDAILLIVQNKEDGIATLHREAGLVRGDIFEAKTHAYENAITNGSNVSEARHQADYAVVNLQKELYRLEGEIAAYTAERDALLVKLAHENG